MYFNLKAESKNKTIVFSLEDCPVKISSDKFVLKNRANSPMLYTKTIRRCSDVYSTGGGIVAEGDVIVEDKSSTEYVVKWLDNFKVINNSNEIFSLIKLHPISIIGKKLVPNVNSSLYYKYEDKVFHLFEIIACNNGVLYLNRKDIPNVPLSDIEQIFMFKNTKIPIGSKCCLKDGRVGVFRLHRGEICVYVDDMYISLCNLKNKWSLIKNI